MWSKGGSESEKIRDDRGRGSEMFQMLGSGTL